MFIDVCKFLDKLTSHKMKDRLIEITSKGKFVSIAAIGGFPIIENDGDFTFLGQPILSENLRFNFIQALGLGGMLTYLNPSKKSLFEMGSMCLKSDHDWTYHTVNVTLFFVRYSPFVESSFSRDGRFHMSWVEDDATGPDRTFMVTGSLKQWKKYTKHRFDKDFHETQRCALSDAHLLLHGLFPEYFNV